MSSPGWILQAFKPQFVLRVEGDNHLMITQYLQTEREMPHADLVLSRRPGEGDGVLSVALHSQPAGS